MPKLQLPRLFTWIILSLALIAAIAFISPHQLPLVLYTQGQVLLFDWLLSISGESVKSLV